MQFRLADVECFTLSLRDFRSTRMAGQGDNDRVATLVAQATELVSAGQAEVQTSRDNIPQSLNVGRMDLEPFEKLPPSHPTTPP